ncbi:MAG: carboxypeptidase-like regulatory domain-containing protein, partial [bacterium]
MRRALLAAALAVTALAVTACDDAPGDADDDATPPGDAAAADAQVEARALSVSGHAFSFSANGGPIEGATVRLLEDPERTATTAADGSFRFDGLPDGSQVTFVLEDPDLPPIQTGTHTLAGEDMERLTFQAPDFALYNALAAIVQLTPDPARCQIASTVTRRGNSLYDEIPGTHGEPEATVTLEPEPDDVDGPIYFDLVRYNAIFPSRMLSQTTADGGVLFLNVPPGEYTLRAHKPATEFRDVHITCRAGFI